MDETLERRIARLEAIDEIRGLMADYTHFFDTGWSGAGRDPDKVAALFTEDGVWGETIGPAAIRDWCATYGHTAKMSLHIAMNPKIEVDGDQAQGSWSGLVPLVAPSGEALWVGGRYECDFVRRAGEWKIRRLRFFTAFQTPYEDGFGKTRFYNPAVYERGT
jgi:hypothetical protein